MLAVVPRVERVAFAGHHSSNDLLSTDVSSSDSGIVQSFSNERLAAISRLAELAQRRAQQCGRAVASFGSHPLVARSGLVALLIAPAAVLG